MLHKQHSKSKGSTLMMGIVRSGLFGILLMLFGSQAIANSITEFGMQHKPGSSQVLDHSDWQNLLSEFVTESEDGINRVNYAQFKGQNYKGLVDYLTYLENIVVSDLNQREQLAYWINFYNALTVRVILDHFPVESIKEISYSLLSFGPWSEELVVVEGNELSLDDIEHKIIRPVFQDSRIHYAVNCAALGCPNLQNIAFTSSNLDQMMDKAARAFINHPRGIRFTEDGLVMSSLFHWYRDDFELEDGGLIKHFNRFADSDLKAKMAEGPVIDGHEYDWSLNSDS